MKDLSNLLLLLLHITMVNFEPFTFMTGWTAVHKQHIVPKVFSLFSSSLATDTKEKQKRTKKNDALVARPNKHKNIIKSKTSKKLGITHRHKKNMKNMRIMRKEME